MGNTVNAAVSRFASWMRGYPLAAIAVTGLALVCLPLRGNLPLPALMLVFVPLIVWTAALGGAGPSSFASILSLALLDLFFVQPYYVFTVADPSEWIALIVFLVVSLIAGRQTARLLERERAALERQRQLELLNRLSASVVSEKRAVDTAGLTARQVVHMLDGGRAAIYVDAGDGSGKLLAEAGDAAEEAEAELVTWVLRSGKAIGLSSEHRFATDPHPVSVPADGALADRSARGVYLPLHSAGRLEGVLLARPTDGRDAPAGSAGFLVGVANIAALALERERLEAEAARLIAEHEADRLKSTLVSSVSHELKTPLAAATARITGLIDSGSDDLVEIGQEVREVRSDLDRLNRSIGDLLDLSRLESDAWRPRPEVYEVTEILGSVRDRLTAAQQARLVFEIPALSPLVEVDFTQMQRALTNVVENAMYYSAAGSPVTITVQGLTSRARVVVADVGPGVPDAEKERVFEKFFRGAASPRAQSGTGLGLAITAEIVRAHEGRVWVEDRDRGGACFIVELPRAEARHP